MNNINPISANMSSSIQQVMSKIYDLFVWVINSMDQIIIAPIGISLLKFVLGIAIIGMFIPIILAIPKGIKIKGERVKHE